MTVDLSSLDAVMKSYYNDSMYEELVYTSRPLLALLDKHEKFVGKNMPIPLKISDGGGVSGTFSVAQAQAASGAPKFEDFVLTHAQLFSVAQIDGLAVETARASAGSFIDGMTSASDSAYNRLANQVAIQLFRSGAGELGQVLAEPSEASGSFVITLKSSGDFTNINVGSTVQLYAALTGGSAKTSDGTDDEWVVAGVDASAGTVTLTGDYTASGNIAANDYFFLEGTRGATAGLTGLAGWLPQSVPSSTLFFGVDRTIDATKLAGVRHDGSLQSIDEALISASYKVDKVGGAPDIVVMSSAQYGKLVNSLSSKVQFTSLQVGGIGFRGIELHGASGTIKVISDRNCPDAVAYLLDRKSWKLCTAGKAVGPVKMAGASSMWRTQESADGLECRFAFRGNLACNAPGHNAVVILPAL